MQRLLTDEQHFRYFMRTVPSSVVVVTTVSEAGKRGFTVGSFCSVSLDPLMVSFNAAHHSHMFQVLAGAEHFAVHLLSHHQQHVAIHFALPGLSEDEQFGVFETTASKNGVPLLDVCCGILECRIAHRFPAGDHDIVVGRVERIRLEDDSAPPLVYYNREYTSVRSADQG